MTMITLIVGLMIGACLGLLAGALCGASARADEMSDCIHKNGMIEQLAEALVDAKLALKEMRDGLARE